MRFHRLLDEVLDRRSKVAILRFLVRSRGEHSGRDLARLMRLDHKTCHAALQDLVEQGLVRVLRMGRAHVYSLNPSHVVVREMLAPLFRREEALLQHYVRDLRKSLRGRTEAVVLFGSAARREEKARSDVDLLWVASDRRSAESIRDRLDGATTAMLTRYGSVPQILVADLRSFRRRIAGGDALYGEIVKTGRVVHGKSFRELLRNGG